MHPILLKLESHLWKTPRLQCRRRLFTWLKDRGPLAALNVCPAAAMASSQRKGLQTRILSPAEQEKLKRDQALVSPFKQQKLEKEAQKNWDLFYKRNSTNFFKDRHWTTREFEELRSCREYEGQKLTVLEAGCGVGNCLFPLLEEDLDIFAYACDFSPRAVDYVKQHPLYNAERCKVFQCDLTRDDLLDHVPPESVDAVTLIFVLSAVHPEKMHLVLLNVCKRLPMSSPEKGSLWPEASPAALDLYSAVAALQSIASPRARRVLKPGGSVLFRDYGLNDHAMLRFKAGSKLGENFYVRQDGTRSYFFTVEAIRQTFLPPQFPACLLEFLAQLFVDAGYEEVVSEYVFRETVNKKEGLCVPRVFLQSKFRKLPKGPAPAIDSASL
ncbi:tRNA N(3)-methylcytidine methyltransferase METTL6 [Apodemus speciosus]|uniref:tRNA N(3)-cytidine methyltransferase n=1 Tax=Apodemus speciosus TaxID=105296 RepID=A0ABQ0FHL5_APOSI